MANARIESHHWKSALNIKIGDEYSFLTIFKHYPVYLHR